MLTLSISLFLSAVVPAHVIVVHAGQSIQAAVNFAQPGDTIQVQSGRYHEAGTPCPYDVTSQCAVSISKDGISLVGVASGGKPVVLDNPTGLDDGISVGKVGADAYHCETTPKYRLRGSRIVGFTVRGFKGSGIVLDCVDEWELAYDNAADNFVYGLYPVKVGHGRMHHNVVTGSNDTGLYVGQAHDVRVDHNVAFGNVSGYEFENTVNSLLDHNVAFGNTGGILEFELTGDAVLKDGGNTISDNFVHDNNKKNTCSGGDVCGVPQGTGILMVTGAHNATLRNTVVGNKAYGIALADFCTAFMLPPNCGGLGFNPAPRHNVIAGNTALGNGADLIWTGVGTGNCWLGNRARTVVPKPLPVCRS